MGHDPNRWHGHNASAASYLRTACCSEWLTVLLSVCSLCFRFSQFHFNPAQSILVMEGEDLENMNAAVRKVSYINSRQFPTPGIRRLHISTAVQYVQSFSTLYLHSRCLQSCGLFISVRLPPR